MAVQKPSYQFEIERWALRLQMYSFSLVYKKGKDNPADYLSRHPRFSTKPSSREQKISEEYVHFVTMNAMPKALTLKEVSLETENDRTLQTVMELLYTGRWYELDKSRSDYKMLLLYQKVKTQLTVNFEDGVLLKHGKIVLPVSLQNRAID